MITIKTYDIISKLSSTMDDIEPNKSIFVQVMYDNKSNFITKEMKITKHVDGYFFIDDDINDSSSIHDNIYSRVSLFLISNVMNNIHAVRIVMKNEDTVIYEYPEDPYIIVADGRKSTVIEINRGEIDK
jgi:hypothetical protein